MSLMMQRGQTEKKTNAGIREENMISCREFSTKKINELTSVLSSDIYKLQSEYDASKWMGLIHVHAYSQLIKHFF